MSAAAGMADRTVATTERMAAAARVTAATTSVTAATTTAVSLRQCRSGACQN
jgi:glucan phosphoethanolaminetransferase (alkaline phosphatase superfamily)